MVKPVIDSFAKYLLEIGGRTYSWTSITKGQITKTQEVRRIEGQHQHLLDDGIFREQRRKRTEGEF